MSFPQPSRLAPSRSPGDTRRAGDGPLARVLVPAALGALALDGDEHPRRHGSHHHRHAFNPRGQRPPATAATQRGRADGADTAAHGSARMCELRSACVAMSDTCAGMRDRAGLGSVLLAGGLYPRDEGDNLAAPGQAPAVQHDVRTDDLHHLWSIPAATRAGAGSLNVMANDGNDRGMQLLRSSGAVALVSVVAVIMGPAACGS